LVPPSEQLGDDEFRSPASTLVSPLLGIG